ncbi:MAG: ribonuclease HI [Chitinophagaceae bacterium]
MSHPLHIYTDGAARGNPGPGGFGIVLIWGDLKKEIAQGYRFTTNNRMELLAVIVALESLTRKNIPVNIFTDSKYVVDSIEKKWVDNWMKTDFKGGKKNKDLWMRYYHLAKQFTIKMHWVKGHASNEMNNRCDVLATTAADGKNLLVDIGYENAPD